MNSESFVIKVPNSLGLDFGQLDNIYQLIQDTPDCTSYVLDMDDVSFIKSYGVIGLLLRLHSDPDVCPSNDWL
jgi:hypothetical protein